MGPDFPARALAFAVPALLVFAAAAAALTIDLGKIPDSRPISLEVSSTDANRIELPETIINAFSSSESMDVKIVGNSALVRAGDPAELIILTEKRRLSLLLVPEEIPSRTVIMRDGDTPPGRLDKKSGRDEATEPLPYEKAITDLVISLARDLAWAGSIPEKEVELADSLFLAHLGEAASPPLFASLYVARNGGARRTALAESMFSADPQTVAVGLERNELLPGEAARVFVVTKKEPGR